ncbi:hypothetical protein E2C01_058461 [Portunus trituberculatus]|uniref:Uncharacterized protein n=1 Tax=Portunus trituberculatus TaxID=210409 RepID=A0A5B7H4R5_PORTR|nr:hypothetical protein [Portunus trituberculatus]
MGEVLPVPSPLSPSPFPLTHRSLVQRLVGRLPGVVQQIECSGSRGGGTAASLTRQLTHHPLRTPLPIPPPTGAAAAATAAAAAATNCSAPHKVKQWMT